MKSNLKQLLTIISKEVQQPRKRQFNIVLEGNIGSGKTTFLNYFQHNKSISIDSEPLDLWCDCNGHNLLALQYEDPTKWSASLQSYIQLTMLQLHLKQVQQPVRMIERSIYSGRHCFIENMIRENTMPLASAAVLDKWFKFITENIDLNVDLIVYLRTSPEVVFKRMMARSRTEEKKIPFEYIENLHNLHEEWLTQNGDKLPAPVLIIDGNIEKHCFEQEFLQHSNVFKDFREKVSSIA